MIQSSTSTKLALLHERTYTSAQIQNLGSRTQSQDNEPAEILNKAKPAERAKVKVYESSNFQLYNSVSTLPTCWRSWHWPISLFWQVTWWGPCMSARSVNHTNWSSKKSNLWDDEYPSYEDRQCRKRCGRERVSVIRALVKDGKGTVSSHIHLVERNPNF